MYVEPAPEYLDLMTEVGGDRLLPILRADLKERGGEYIHWDKLRRLPEARWTEPP